MMKTKTTLPQFKKWKFFLLSIPFMLCSQASMSQTQVGVDIDGEAAGDLSGKSVSMPDAYTVAIGADRNDGNGTESGHVRVYKWNGNSWVQKGGDIDGKASSDWSGWSVSMPDSNTVAIGAPAFMINHAFAVGHVRIYKWNGTAWVQKGVDIDGEASGDNSGSAVCMPDSNTVAIGAIWNDGNGSNSGQVRIYSWNGSAWIQKGGDIDGEAANDGSGGAVSMSDSNTVAIGAHANDGNGIRSGHVRVYRWNGFSWTQKGMDIDGDSAGDNSGRPVSLPDSNTVAIGALYNDGNGTDAGHVRIYKWNGNSWTQKGGDIDGESAGDWSGVSVSMSDSNTVAIGAQLNDGNGSYSGHVRIYRWSGVSWQQRGVDIDGEAAGDGAGFVSMPDNNTVAIGAPWNDANRTDAGHVRVYSLCNGSVDTSVTLSANTLIANDSNVTYQWVYCDSAYAPLIGETNRNFTPPNTGNYSVIVSRSHCVDTSTCYNVVITGLEHRLESNIKILVYPNPTNGVFTIESTAENKNAAFEIRDITGKIVLKGSLRGKQTTLDLSENSSGLYILRVGDQNVKIVRK